MEPILEPKEPLINTVLPVVGVGSNSFDQSRAVTDSWSNEFDPTGISQLNYFVYSEPFQHCSNRIQRTLHLFQVQTAYAADTEAVGYG